MALLRHLALRCRDVEVSRRFCEEGIGFRFVGYRPSGISIDLSDGTNNITLLPYGDKQRPKAEMAHFIDCLRGRAEPLITAGEMQANQAMIDGIYAGSAQF